MLGGSALGVGGGLLSLSVVGSPVGVPAVLVGSGFTAHGLLTVTTARMNMSKTEETQDQANDDKSTNGSDDNGSLDNNGISEEPEVQFGNGTENQTYHAFRHTDELGLDREAVRSSVLSDIKKAFSNIQAGKPFNKVIEVAGQKIQYTAFKLANGKINIGRIHGVK
jgi:hypothetical protein